MKNELLTTEFPLLSVSSAVTVTDVVVLAKTAFSTDRLRLGTALSSPSSSSASSSCTSTTRVASTRPKLPVYERVLSELPFDAQKLFPDFTLRPLALSLPQLSLLLLLLLSSSPPTSQWHPRCFVLDSSSLALLLHTPAPEVLAALVKSRTRGIPPMLILRVGPSEEEGIEKGELMLSSSIAVIQTDGCSERRDGRSGLRVRSVERGVWR